MVVCVSCLWDRMDSRIAREGVSHFKCVREDARTHDPSRLFIFSMVYSTAFCKAFVVEPEGLLMRMEEVFEGVQLTAFHQVTLDESAFVRRGRLLTPSPGCPITIRISTTCIPARYQRSICTFISNPRVHAPTPQPYDTTPLPVHAHNPINLSTRQEIHYPTDVKEHQNAVQCKERKSRRQRTEEAEDDGNEDKVEYYATVIVHIWKTKKRSKGHMNKITLLSCHVYAKKEKQQSQEGVLLE